MPDYIADVVFLPLPAVKKPALEGYSGEIPPVGINYDKDNANKPHKYVIERLEM